MRNLHFLFALVPLGAFAQALQQPSIPEPLPPPSVHLDGGAPLNATTLAVLRANQPKNMSWEEWLRIMRGPDGATLYPLRVTQAMLDTLDGREMDPLFRYQFVTEIRIPR